MRNELSDEMKLHAEFSPNVKSFRVLSMKLLNLSEDFSKMVETSIAVVVEPGCNLNSILLVVHVVLS